MGLGTWLIVGGFLSLLLSILSKAKATKIFGDKKRKKEFDSSVRKSKAYFGLAVIFFILFMIRAIIILLGN